ncbi:hypothetical protein Tco_0389852, partial [Tanacetum coccineum]
MGGNSLELGIGVMVEKLAGGVISLPLVIPENSWGECLTAKSRITCNNKNGNTTLSEAHGVSLRITSGVKVRTVYHDLYLGEKTLVERENVGFDLTKSDLCPSFAEDLTAKGVGLRVADSLTGNHRKD